MDAEFAIDIVPFQDSSNLKREILEINETNATNNDSSEHDPSSTITDSANNDKITSPESPPSPLSSAEGVPSSVEGASSPAEGVASSTEGTPPLRCSTRRRNPVDRLQLHLNSNINTDTQLLSSMFKQASRPSGLTQTTFNGTNKPSKLSAVRVNQQYTYHL